MKIKIVKHYKKIKNAI